MFLLRVVKMHAVFALYFVMIVLKVHKKVDVKLLQMIAIWQTYKNLYAEKST